MNENSTTVRYTLSEIKSIRDRGEDEIDPNSPEAESHGADFWSTAHVVMPRGITGKETP